MDDNRRDSACSVENRLRRGELSDGQKEDGASSRKAARVATKADARAAATAEQQATSASRERQRRSCTRLAGWGVGNKEPARTSAAGAADGGSKAARRWSPSTADSKSEEAGERDGEICGVEHGKVSRSL